MLASAELKADNASPLNGSALVLLNFSSDAPCWFDLTTASGDCGRISETFRVSPHRRTLGDVQAISIGSQERLARITTTSKLAARAVAAADSPETGPRGDNLSAGAKVGLGIGVALVCIAIGAMAAFWYFKRRRRDPDTELGHAIFEHSRRPGRKGPEKKRNGASSVASGQSDEPLCPIQPVFDGYPGSMGYEDVRSLHSTANSHSPILAHPPALPHNLSRDGYDHSVERDELTAARLKSQLQPSVPAVISYGPNPVTPTLPTRITPRADVNARAGGVSPDSTTATPHGPTMASDYTDYSDYTSYSIPPPRPMPEQTPSPRNKAAIAIVVSYGPNRVTPTPLVLSPTVPTDEAIVNRRYMETAAPVVHERQFSWEADSPLLGAAMGPLPPYASTEDFEAMEKGAVRKLPEPALAELPPTKDGFYHYTSHVPEYELPGAAPQHEPQLPFDPYKVHPQTGFSGGGRTREIDEQKFLLSDVEISKMKAKARAARVKEESYDLGEPSSHNWR